MSSCKLPEYGNDDGSTAGWKDEESFKKISKEKEKKGCITRYVYV